MFKNPERGDCMAIIAMLIAIIGGFLLLSLVWDRVGVLVQQAINAF